MVLVSIVLLLTAGIGHRLVAGHLATATASVPLPRGTLAALPLTLGDWMGKDVPLEERVIQATDTDDHVHRSYRRGGGRESVSLLIAYGVRMRDLLPHRPEVCYPSAGWTLAGKESVLMTPPNGQPFEAQAFRFRRGGLASDQLIVLNYYVIDGKPHANVASLRSKSWRVENQVRYVAQIQVVASDEPLRADAQQAALSFGNDSATAIIGVLESAVRAAMTGTRPGEPLPMTTGS